VSCAGGFPNDSISFSWRIDFFFGTLSFCWFAPYQQAALSASRPLRHSGSDQLGIQVLLQRTIADDAAKWISRMFALAKRCPDTEGHKTGGKNPPHALGAKANTIIEAIAEAIDHPDGNGANYPLTTGWECS